MHPDKSNQTTGDTYSLPITRDKRCQAPGLCDLHQEMLPTAQRSLGKNSQLQRESQTTPMEDRAMTSGSTQRGVPSAIQAMQEGQAADIDTCPT
jgi:hypothetical protein